MSTPPLQYGQGESGQDPSPGENNWVQAAGEHPAPVPSSSHGRSERLARRTALLRPARFPRPWRNRLAVLQLPEQ